MQNDCALVVVSLRCVERMCRVENDPRQEEN